jgi:hypothetical protein
MGVSLGTRGRGLQCTRTSCQGGEPRTDAGQPATILDRGLSALNPASAWCIAFA